jgi:molecular chaperone GrpE
VAVAEPQPGATGTGKAEDESEAGDEKDNGPEEG